MANQAREKNRPNEGDYRDHQPGQRSEMEQKPILDYMTVQVLHPNWVMF